jgi:hypothetical protein
VAFRSVFIYAMVIAFMGSSCAHKNHKPVREGEVHYSVSYQGHITHMPKELMPRNMVVSFKDDKIIYQLISPIGNSGIINLCNPSKDVYDTYLTMFTIRYYYQAKPDEWYPGFEAMKGIEIVKTSKTREICGLICKNAEVTFPADRSKVYDIWYNDELGIKNPNSHTPFESIDGLLMSFFFFIGHSELRFEAENVYRKDIPEETFERRAKFVRVSRNDMNKFIHRMVNL